MFDQRTGRRCCAVLHAIARQQRVSSSGFLAAPFVALSFATLQTAIIFFAGQALETATATSKRVFILTGSRLQTQSWSAAQFKQRKSAVLLLASFNCRERRLH